MTGKIILDSMGDRIPEFWLLDMNNDVAQFQVAMNISVDIIDDIVVRVSRVTFTVLFTSLHRYCFNVSADICLVLHLLVPFQFKNW